MKQRLMSSSGVQHNLPRHEDIRVDSFGTYEGIGNGDRAPARMFWIKLLLFLGFLLFPFGLAALVACSFGLRGEVLELAVSLGGLGLFAIFVLLLTCLDRSRPLPATPVDGLMNEQEMARLMNDPAELDRILAHGARQARELTAPILKKTYEIVGMVGA